MENLNDIRLSESFKLGEFLNLRMYPNNIPNIEQVINLHYGVLYVLQPLRVFLNEPIIVTSGFRNAAVNKRVGGVSNSQHLLGQAADIKPQDPHLFEKMKRHLITSALPYDQLLTGNGWLHVSWKPNGKPRSQVVENYYLR